MLRDIARCRQATMVLAGIAYDPARLRDSVRGKIGR
jgi:hypothetical protein